MPQAAAHPFVDATGIRAYAGVPVRRADGSLYGTLCCLSREPQPQLGERDLRYLDVLARMAAHRLAAAEGAQLHRRAEVEAAAGQALLAALNARENYTAAHSEAVLELALEVAAELGMDGEDATSVGQVALLHDIGKVGVPDAILRKPGRLTAPEWEVMREHPAIGAQIVERDRLALAPRPGRARRARALGRRRLPRRARRRGRPARQPHLLRLRRLARDDLRPPVPARAHPRAGARGAASATPARSSARPPSPRSLRVLDRGGGPAVEAPADASARERRCRASGPTGRWRPSCAR